MPSLTYQEILDRVRIELDDRKEKRFRTPDLKGWVREAHRDVWKAVCRTGEGYMCEENDVTYPASTRHTPLGTLLGETREVVHVLSVADVTDVTGSDPGTPMEQGIYSGQFQVDDRTDALLSRDTGRMWFLFGSPLRLGIAPIPSTARTLRILWRPSLTMMVDPDDTPEGIPQDVQEGIVARATALAKAAANEDPSLAEMRYMKAEDSLVPHVNKRARQGSRRVRMVGDLPGRPQQTWR